MIKKITTGLMLVVWMMSLCGCIAVVAGAAGGAGTAVWLSGKLTDNVDAPFDRCIQASESTLSEMKLEETKKTVQERVAQIMGKYSDGKTIWIDVRKLTEKSTQIAVRVGAVVSDKEASNKILMKIKSKL